MISLLSELIEAASATIFPLVRFTKIFWRQEYVGVCLLAKTGWFRHHGFISLPDTPLMLFLSFASVKLS